MHASDPAYFSRGVCGFGSKRIAMVTNNYLPRETGVPIAVANLSRALKERGMEVRIIAPKMGLDDEMDDENVVRIPAIHIPFRRWSIPLPKFFRQKIVQLFNAFRPDVVHVHHPFWLGKEAADWAWTHHRPVVWTFHTWFQYYTGSFPIISKSIGQSLLKQCVEFGNRCQAVVCANQELRKELRERGIQTPIFVIPQTISPHFLKDNCQQRNSSLPILLYVGRVVKEKNVDFLLKVARVLKQKIDRWEMWVVGGGSRLSALKNRARQWGLNPHVIFWGHQSHSELPTFYRAASLLTFPSFTDTQGLVVSEALAMQVPVVAVDSEAARSAIRSGENGYVTSRRVHDFSSAVQHVIQKPIRLKPLIYDEQEMCSRLLSCYAEVCHDS